MLIEEFVINLQKVYLVLSKLDFIKIEFAHQDGPGQCLMALQVVVLVNSVLNICLSVRKQQKYLRTLDRK